MTTNQFANEIGITPKSLRRILRSFDKYDDKKYTRYKITDADKRRVMKSLEPPADETNETN